MRVRNRFWSAVAGATLWVWDKTRWDWAWKLNGKACYEVEVD